MCVVTLFDFTVEIQVSWYKPVQMSAREFAGSRATVTVIDV